MDEKIRCYNDEKARIPFKSCEDYTIQFALANQACSLVPLTASSMDLNHTSAQVTADDDDDDGDDDDDDDGSDDGDEERERPHRGEHGNGHGQRHRNGHGHRQRHGHGGTHQYEPQSNKDCCRWVEDVDESCVCATLLHLPYFLLKVNHSYGVHVGRTCSRTFHCRAV